jgi:hypothetical protein
MSKAKAAHYREPTDAEIEQMAKAAILSMADSKNTRRLEKADRWASMRAVWRIPYAAGVTDTEQRIAVNTADLRELPSDVAQRIAQAFPVLPEDGADDIAVLNRRLWRGLEEIERLRQREKLYERRGAANTRLLGILRKIRDIDPGWNPRHDALCDEALAILMANEGTP